MYPAPLFDPAELALLTWGSLSSAATDFLLLFSPPSWEADYRKRGERPLVRLMWAGGPARIASSRRFERHGNGLVVSVEPIPEGCSQASSK